MDESERRISESDLSYYEEEVEVNAYGSPTGPIRTVNRAQCTRETTVNGTVTAPSTSDDNCNRVVCNCKNTCSRKKSARYDGCPCQNANVKCTRNCNCGTKKAPCKNQVEEGQEIGNPSAFARHRQAVEDSQREIKDFVTKLTSDDKDQLLIRLLSQGRGSLEFARNMLTGSDNTDPPSPQPEENIPETWCMCRVCRRMPEEQENVCCKKRTCVTSYVMFNTVCLDREVLQLAIRARCDIRADQPDYSTQSYRKAAYRQYTLWKFGKLGRGNRKILPSCVVLAIRLAYPAPDGNYMGFRRS